MSISTLPELPLEMWLRVAREMDTRTLHSFYQSSTLIRELVKDVPLYPRYFFSVMVDFNPYFFYSLKNAVTFYLDRINSVNIRQHLRPSFKDTPWRLIPWNIIEEALSLSGKYEPLPYVVWIDDDCIVRNHLSGPYTSGTYYYANKNGVQVCHRDLEELLKICPPVPDKTRGKTVVIRNGDISCMAFVNSGSSSFIDLGDPEERKRFIDTTVKKITIQ